MDVAGQIAQQFNPAGDLKAGTDAAVGLATMQEDIEQKKNAVEAQRLQLGQAKLDSTLKLANNYLRASDPVRKQMKDRIINQSRSFGADITGLIDLFDANPEMGRGFQAAIANPEMRKHLLDNPDQILAIATGDDVLGLQDHMSQFLDMAKDKTSNKVALEKENIKAQAGIDKAKLMGGQRQQSMDLRKSALVNKLNNQYDSSPIGKMEQRIDQANKLAHLVAGITSGKLKSNATVVEEIKSGLNALNTGDRPTVSGTHAQSVNTAYERMAKAEQWLTGDPKNSLTNSQLKQLKNDLEVLKDATLENYNMAHASKQKAADEIGKGVLSSRQQEFLSQHGLGENKKDAAQSAPVKKFDENGLFSVAKGYALNPQEAVSKMKQAGVPKDVIQRVMGRVLQTHANGGKDVGSGY